MARLVLNRDGGKTDEFGHILGLSRFTTGEVIEGLEVTAQGSPNMSVSVSAGSAKIPYGTGGTRYDYWVANDAAYSVTIATADPANPRIDYIIGVVDRTVTPSTAVTNNSNNMFKIIAVSGTPAASPSVPTGTQMQTAAGTGNPYIILRRVNVPAGVTQITSSQISTDLRSMVTPVRKAVTSDGALNNMLYYTSNGTWTKPAGLKFIVVEVQAGGGGGGFSGIVAADDKVGAGGGGGGYVKKKILAADLSTTETITVGNGGNGSSGGGGVGDSGGASSFGAHLTAGGGAGGSHGSSDSNGGLGGTATGGDFNIPGDQGGASGAIQTQIAAYFRNGFGGSSFLGSLTIRKTFGGTTQSGSDGRNYGSGGSGGVNNGATASGGNGAQGVVIVHEYL